MEVITNITISGETVIKINGDMDSTGCQELKPKIEKILEEMDGVSLILDLFDVPFLDSSGIGAIVFMFKRLKANDKSFEIIGVNGQPKEILHLLRIDKAIPISYMQSNLKVIPSNS